MVTERRRRKTAPIRTCVICGKKLPKNEMIRLVRSRERLITLDESGKLGGRGTYLCSPACWKSNNVPVKISQSLRAELDNDHWKTILMDLEER